MDKHLKALNTRRTTELDIEWWKGFIFGSAAILFCWLVLTLLLG